LSEPRVERKLEKAGKRARWLVARWCTRGSLSGRLYGFEDDVEDEEGRVSLSEDEKRKKGCEAYLAP
jgi:hypothetical protein